MYAHQNQLPPVVKNLLIINVLMFIGQNIFALESFLALRPISNGFQIHQLISYSFLHGNITHLFFNMLPIWLFGRSLEGAWGSKRFMNFYLLTAIGAAIIHLFFTNSGAIGASGAVFGILAGFGMLFPNTQLFLLFPPVPIKAKYFVIGYGLIELAYIYFEVNDGVAHHAHLGGAIIGYIIIKFWNKNRNHFY